MRLWLKRPPIAQRPFINLIQFPCSLLGAKKGTERDNLLLLPLPPPHTHTHKQGIKMMTKALHCIVCPRIAASRLPWKDVCFLVIRGCANNRSGDHVLCWIWYSSQLLSLSLTCNDNVILLYRSGHTRLYSHLPLETRPIHGFLSSVSTSLLLACSSTYNTTE